MLFQYLFCMLFGFYLCNNIFYYSNCFFTLLVNLFDVYEGDKLPEGKKSYALSFTMADDSKTLTDKYVDKVMDKLIKSFKEKVAAEVR